MTFSILDSGILSSETIGTTTLNAKKWMKKVQLQKEGMEVEKQWLPLRKKINN